MQKNLITHSDSPDPQEDSTETRATKAAPRSCQQFKVGPAFRETVTTLPILASSTNKQVVPIIDARIDRGFDNVNGAWIGYKRNYFTLVAAFGFKDLPDDIVARESFRTRLGDISSFGIKLESCCCEDDSIIDLIQHTAKRDRGPQTSPPEYCAIPGKIPDHNVIRKSSNIRNESKISTFSRIFYSDFSEMELTPDCILRSYPAEPAAIVARYERIQFSSAVNYRKPSLMKRSFCLRVILFAKLASGETVDLAFTRTPPLIIRGRSPSNYKRGLGDASPKTTKQSPKKRPRQPLSEINVANQTNLIDPQLKKHLFVTLRLEGSSSQKDDYSSDFDLSVDWEQMSPDYATTTPQTPSKEEYTSDIELSVDLEQSAANLVANINRKKHPTTDSKQDVLEPSMETSPACVINKIIRKPQLDTTLIIKATTPPMSFNKDVDPFFDLDETVAKIRKNYLAQNTPDSSFNLYSDQMNDIEQTSSELLDALPDSADGPCRNTFFDDLVVLERHSSSESLVSSPLDPITYDVMKNTLGSRCYKAKVESTHMEASLEEFDMYISFDIE